MVRLYYIIRNPTTEKYKHILIQHMIKNLPVNIDDVNLAEKSFGTNIVSIKVNITSIKLKPVKYDVL